MGFGFLPCRVVLPGGAEVVRRMASLRPQRIPMTRPKSNTKAASRSAARKPKSTSRKRSAPARRGTKHAHIVAMLRSPNGATIAAIMAATEWQQHSVRGFLAGVVRKKLGLNLVSESTDKGRVYRIKDSKASSGAADRVKQAA